MGEEKSSPSSVARGSLDRDLERLIPVAEDPADDSASASAAAAAHHHSGREAFHRVVHSWASKKFMTGCNLAGSEKEPLYGSGSLIHSFGGAYIIVLIEVEDNSYSLYWLQEHQNICFILLPIAITFYITWWFIHFVDGFFSPIYAGLGIDIFGLGFITSITFIFLIGVFMSSWLGASVLSLGEWFIKRMPFIRYIYNASKQISTAISPDQNTQAFKEVVIIRHPRIGEYAFGFITSSVVLQNYSGEEHLICVYVPTNHLYIGDIFMINVRDVFRPNLSVREGMEIVVSGGMSMPQMLSTLESH